MDIVLAEDSALLREALVALFERFGWTVSAAVETAPQLVSCFESLASRERRPDVIVTDVRMPPEHREDGLQAALQIRALAPTQPIVVLSQYIAETYARDVLALPEGGIGYVLKDRVNRVHDFRRTLETVAAGGTVIDPEVVQRLLASSAAAPSGPLARLTPREREVLSFMADGASNAEIAARLVVSDAAVSKHIGNVFQKLGLSPVEENRRVKAVLTYVQSARSDAER